MAESFFITDGYTASDKVPARPGKHPALPFEYRPVISSRLAQFVRAINKNRDAEHSLEVSLVKEHLVSWELPGEDGKPVKITEEAIGALHPSIHRYLVNAVTGYGDTPEEQSDRKN